MSGVSTNQATVTTANGNSSGQEMLQNVQLNSELKNLMGILTGKGGSINLEQLLAGGHSSRPQLKPNTPTHHPTVVPSSSLSNTPSLGAALTGRKRGRSFDFDMDSAKRRRGGPSYSSRQSGEKQHNKGLRHFSQRVCEKVREKGATTYNEVADELVKELTETEKKSSSSEPIDHKNIRRRVYDALNVLMAMNIISKEKKEIKWLGLPTNSAQECQHIEAELEQAEERIRAKQSEVEDLLIQILSFKNLMKKNRERVAKLGAPSQNSAISLPFLVVNTSKKTTIDCSISSDKSEYVFSFDNAFELHNDIDVLKKMGLDCGLHSGECSGEDLKLAKSMLPKGFESTVDEIAMGKKVIAATGPPSTPCSSSNLHLTSTPSNPTASPSTLSPLLQSGPQNQASLIIALNQLKAAVAASPICAGSSATVTTGQTAGNSPLVNLSSPQAVTALVSEALKGAKSGTPNSPLQLAPSPTATPRSQLQNQCTSQQNTMSPLLKSMGTASPISSGTVPSVPNGSPQVAKSPGPKIVTVSKLPPAMTTQNDQLCTLLQTLQQHTSTSALLKPVPGTTNGIIPDGHQASSSSNEVV